MKREWPCTLSLLMLAGISAGALAQPVLYQLDPSHSFVHFDVVHFGTSTVHGRFGPVQGQVSLDREAGSGHVGLTIATSTVSTGFSPLDSRMRESDLLATQAYPEAFFVSDKFSFDGATLKEVRGEFTLRGVSRALSLSALRFNCYQSPLFRREVCGGDFEAFINRSEYGSTFGLPFVGDRVRLVISVEAVRQ